MSMHINELLYRLIIDPLLAGVRAAIITKTGHSARVIDIACGTGTLAIDIARSTSDVTAIDLDEDMITYAAERASKKGLGNVHFEARDASDLSEYDDNQFDIAVTSMSVHQFEPQLAVKILSEMNRIAKKVIIADYSCPLPGNLSGKTAKGIERLAGGNHYRNFRNYMNSGGLEFFTGKAGFEIKSARIRGKGVFVVAECR